MACLWIGELGPERTEAQTIIARREQDEAFRMAMYRAIWAGHECPPLIGVWRDERPIGRVTDVSAVPDYSLAGSPAAMMEAW